MPLPATSAQVPVLNQIEALPVVRAKRGYFAVVKQDLTAFLFAHGGRFAALVARNFYMWPLDLIFIGLIIFMFPTIWYFVHTGVWVDGQGWISNRQNIRRKMINYCKSLQDRANQFVD